MRLARPVVGVLVAATFVSMLGLMTYAWVSQVGGP